MVEGEPYRSPAAPPPSEPEGEGEAVDEATKLGLLRSVHLPLPPWRSLVPAGILPVVIMACFWKALGPDILYIGVVFGLVVFALTGWGPLRRRGQIGRAHV